MSTSNGSTLNPSAWPTSSGSLATQFRIYGFNTTTAASGVVIQDADTPGTTYNIVSDSYGNYIDLGDAPHDVDVPLYLLNNSLPNADVPGIALDNEVKTVTVPSSLATSLGLVNGSGSPTTTGDIDALGFQHWAHDTTDQYRSFADVQITMVNPYGAGLWTVTNKNFEGTNTYDYLDYDASMDAYRLNDLFTGVNNSASAGVERADGQSGVARAICPAEQRGADPQHGQYGR